MTVKRADMSEMSDDKTADPRREALLSLLREGMTLEDAAPLAGVSSRQVRRWRAADPELDNAVQDAMSLIDDQVEAVTFRNCIDPDASHNSLRMFWLKSRRPEVYRDKVDQQHSGGLSIRVEYADVHADHHLDAPAPACGSEEDYP